MAGRFFELHTPAVERRFKISLTSLIYYFAAGLTELGNTCPKKGMDLFQ